ncbi:MAG: pirin family protein [Tahibacter sp.]
MSTVIDPREHDLGGGLVVRRVLPHMRARSVGPFVFFDHFGPIEVPAGGVTDVRPHPHIGLATVTYLLRGAMLHRDSLGNVQTIVPGDVNWMTAGSGIVHSERNPPDAKLRGQHLHGLQLWVALPRELEETMPAFVHWPAMQLPEWTTPDITLRVIAGSAYGLNSPLQVASPTLYLAVEMAAGAALQLPNDYAQRAIYVVSGDVEIDGSRLGATRMAVLTTGVEALLRAISPCVVMVLGGAPLDGPRFMWWNFVSSSRERIEQAKADWRSQRMGQVPGETEFIPLPEH